MVFNILSFFHSYNQVIDMMCVPYKEWIDSYGTNMFDAESSKKGFSEGLVYNENHDQLLSLLLFREKLNSNDIKEEFGRRGMSFADDLVELGFIEFDGSVYKPSAEMIDISNPNILVPMVKSQFDAFPMEELGKTVLMWHNKLAYPADLAKMVKVKSAQYVRDMLELNKRASESDLPKTEFLKIALLVDWSLTAGEKNDA